MDKGDYPSPIAVDRAAKVVLCDDGEVYQITDMFDVYGEETDDPAEAVAAVVKIHETCWLRLDLTEFESDGNRETRH